MRLKKYAFLISIILFNCNAYSDELIPFSYDRKYGYVNNELKIVIEPKFINMKLVSAGFFTSCGFATVILELNDGTNSGPIKRIDGIINKNGEVIIRAKPGITHICDDLYSLAILPSEDDVIIRLKDHKIIAKQTGQGPASKNEYILVVYPNEEKRYGFIDFDGNPVLQSLNVMRTSYSFFEQRARITNENWEPQIIDMDGKIVGSITFSDLGQKYTEGLIPAKSKDGVTGYINQSGYYVFTVFFITKNGIPQATDFNDGYAAVKTSEEPSTWKTINKDGQIISSNIYIDMMKNFSCGLSLVSKYTPDKKEVKYGYVNTSGEYLINPILEQGDSFHDGYARIVYNGYEGLLKTNGKVIWSSDIMKGLPVEKELEATPR